ncbi:MAG: FIST C-terminal domain-containing protein [Oscillospiraceae bacterium]|jgi:hypothetical protein|nr:FIST C-terminal domain-containing protein [Oscillospiraceae bacterium]
MIKTVTARTDEIDDVETAVAEILSQLDPENSLLSNSVGILSCYPEFLDSGVIEALAAALPFELSGITTTLSSIDGYIGHLTLAITVFTSDDVRFATALSGEILGGSSDPLKLAYGEAAAKLPSAPKLIIAHAPLLLNAAGDTFVSALDEASGGVPVFGSLCIGHSDPFSASRVISGGKGYANRAALILVCGEIEPKFFRASVPPDKIDDERAVVTKSRGNQLIEVDGMPVLDYLGKYGLVSKEGESYYGMNTYPFIVDNNDGSVPVIRMAIAITPEGYAACGGTFPVGSTIAIGRIDGDDVVSESKLVVSEAVLAGGFSFLLVYACVGRQNCLGYDPEREAETVRDVLGAAGLSYHLAYAGGELCPVPEKLGGTTLSNRNHNDTLIVCAI